MERAKKQIDDFKDSNRPKLEPLLQQNLIVSNFKKNVHGNFKKTSVIIQITKCNQI